jgi:hypothetical protein
MKLLIKSFLTVCFAVTLASCASYKDVRPQADDTNLCIIKTDDVDAATHKCIKEANNYCSKHGDKEPRFMNEGAKYTGSMSEKDYQDSKRVSDIAKSVGGAVWVYGNQNQSDFGNLARASGYAIDSAIGKGYTVEMRFQCK